MPGDLRSELQVSLGLAIFWSADLSRRHLPFLSATDASTSYGFGVSTAAADIDMVRAVSRYAEKRGDYVVLGKASASRDHKAIKPRAGFPRHLNLDIDDFKTMMSVKARRPAHNNILEGEAYLMWLRWLLRSTKHHGTRAVCLVDSKVVLGGVSKGRSSSRPLLRVLRRAAALQLAGNLLTRLIYIPTCCNLADAPSRGVRLRSKLREASKQQRNAKNDAKKSRYYDRLSQTIRNSPYRSELENLLDDDPLFWKFGKRF